MLVLVPAEARRNAHSQVLAQAAADVQRAHSVKAIAIKIAIIIVVQKLPMCLGVIILIRSTVLLQIGKVNARTTQLHIIDFPCPLQVSNLL